MVDEAWQREFRETVDAKMRFIASHKEKLIEAWVAETGLLPSEAVLIQRDLGAETHFFVMKRDDWEPCRHQHCEMVSGRKRDYLYCSDCRTNLSDDGES